MNSVSFVNCCYGLAVSCIISANARSIAKNYSESGLSRLCHNTLQGIALSVLFSKQMVPQHNRLLPVVIIPFTVSLTISGLSYIAQCTNYHANEIEALDKNIGSYMDITIRISSVVFLILLALNTKKSLLHFGMACVLVGINTIAGHLAYLSSDQSH